MISTTPSSIVKAHLGKDGEWQQVEIIARGNTLVHMLNGQVISMTIDDNPDFRALQGILSLQLEGSGQIVVSERLLQTAELRLHGGESRRQMRIQPTAAKCPGAISRSGNR